MKLPTENLPLLMNELKFLYVLAISGLNSSKRTDLVEENLYDEKLCAKIIRCGCGKSLNVYHVSQKKEVAYKYDACYSLSRTSYVGLYCD